MKHSDSKIIKQLVQARKTLGLSQAELGRKMGLPQSHISKVEQGDTDLRTSNLVEMSRLLGLEIMLIPKELITSVNALIQSLSSNRDEAVQPAYPLDNEDQQ